MKHIWLYPVVLFLLLALFSCKDPETIEPAIPAGSRIILVEEFTGKGCTNCPKGSREIANLLAIYDTNLVVVSIHAGFFANPQFFDLGEYDLRTGVGEEIFALLAPNVGYPSAVVNRMRYNGTFQQGTQIWAPRIAEQIGEDPLVDFTIEAEYDGGTRQAIVRVDAIARADIDGEVRLTVQVTEDGIVDAQDDMEAGGIVEDYVHNHVLRYTATTYDGDKVRDGMRTGETFQQEYHIAINPEWDAEACHMVAFVSRVRNGGSDIGVLQAGSAALAP